ncbi:DNA adenine methylase [Candidatus Woesearchaeota archaeon]|nr:DNA adenine methylase [Candidatus Woesearchaeota archaeon]
MSRFYNPAFLKWAGGKTQMLSQYATLYPKEFNHYFEPFLGSGAVFFHIKQKFKPKKCFLSDINEDLINTFNVVKEQPEALIKLLKEHKAKDNSREYFNQQRERFNTLKSGLEKSAIFIYLNKTCFNGLYRVNANGKFNVPFGKYPNPAILQEEKIRKASKLLQDVDISESDFSEVVKEAKEGDFIYFDPPYFPLSKTSSFTSYQKGVFLENEQKELASVFRELHGKGCFVMLSNSDSPFIHQLYQGFTITPVKARRAINCIGTKRGKISEVVVTNYS